jgi:hypothetical protein
MATVQLAVSSSGLWDEALQDLTQELCNSLNEEAHLSASLPTAPPAPGAKGDPITLGVILLSFITSGAAVALFNTLSAYFARSKTLEFVLSKPGGSSVTVKSQNVSAEEREQTLALLSEFLYD